MSPIGVWTFSTCSLQLRCVSASPALGADISFLLSEAAYKTHGPRVELLNTSCETFSSLYWIVLCLAL